jgi:putative peptidoglycan lipid II flippase
VSGLSLRSESFRRGLVQSSAFSLGAKAIAFLVNPAMALYFGAGARTDAYFFCLTTAGVLAGFLASLNSSVVIPQATHLLVRKGAAAAQGFLNVFLLGYCGLALALSAAALAQPVAALAAISRFAPEALAEHGLMIRCFAVVFCLMTVSTLLADILFSYQYFTLPMMCSGGTSALSLAMLVALHGKLGLLCVPAALLAGQLIQVVLLAGLMKRALGWRFSRLELGEAAAVRKDLSLAWLGNAASSLNYYLPSLLLSGLSPGTLTALAYAQSAAGIPDTLVTRQCSAVTGIKLNLLCARRDYANVNRVFLAAAELLHFLLIPAACLMALFSRDIISVLFARGAASVAPATLELSALFLALLAFMAPLNAVNTLTARLFMADRKISLATSYQILSNLALSAAMALLVHYLGATGYPISLLAIYAASITTGRWLFAWRFPYVRYAAVLRTLFVLFLASAGVAGAVYGIVFLLPSLPHLAKLGVASLLFAAFMLTLNARWRFCTGVESLLRGAAGALWARAGAAQA